MTHAAVRIPVDAIASVSPHVNGMPSWRNCAGPMIRIAVELSNLLVIYEYFILLGVPERGSKGIDALLVDGDGCFIAHRKSLLYNGVGVPRTQQLFYPFTLCCRTCDFSLTAWSRVMRLNSPRLRTSAVLWPPGSSRQRISTPKVRNVT